MLNYDHPAETIPLAEHLSGSGKQSIADMDGARIVALLRAQEAAGRMPWVNGADIARALWPELAEHRMESAKRKIRNAVEVNLHIVSAPGSAGYALRERVSPEQDYEVACARYSQAMNMLRKAYRARKSAQARMTALGTWMPPEPGAEDFHPRAHGAQREAATLEEDPDHETRARVETPEATR